MITQEAFKDVDIVLEAIGPVVLAHFPLRFLDVMRKPGDHRLQRSRLRQVFVSAALRFLERLEQGLRAS